VLWIFKTSSLEFKPSLMEGFLIKMDYKFVKDIASSDSKIYISMSLGGGWSAILKPLN
jgi:hypothetical protein